MPDDPQGLTANQLVAYNLMRIRKTLGLSQEEAAARLRPYLGAHWSKSVYSTTERSYHGRRIRQFTADDLVAMSLAFGVPVAYFLLPPHPDDRENGPLRSGEKEVGWRELFEVMLGGSMAPMLLFRTLELPQDERPPSTGFAGMSLSVLAPPPMRDALDAERETDEAAQLAAVTRLPPPGPQTVIAGVVTSDRGVLVTRRVDQNPPWGFTAGWGEPGESPEDTIIREVKEEADLRIRVGEYLGERDHPATGKHMIYYAARPTHGTEIHLGDKGELLEVRWVSLAEADELLPGMFGPVREHLARELGEG